MLRFARVLPVLLLAAACGRGVTPDQIITPRVRFLMADLTVGAGPAAQNGQTLSVAYTGWLYDISQNENKGGEFDRATADDPFMFVLGTGAVIDGWDQGLVGMQVGGVRRLVIPPELGYGAEGNFPIPGNATLVFDIELLAVN